MYESKIFVNDNYVFFNPRNDPPYIYRVDFNGTVKRLNIQGDIRLIVENSNELIITDRITTKTTQYNCDNESIVFEKELTYYPYRFYNSEQGVIVYERNNSYKYLISGDPYYHSSYSFHEDIYPKCNTLLYREMLYDRMYGQELYSFNLVAKDISSGASQSPVSINGIRYVHDDNYSEYGQIFLFKLLNDCRSIIHITEGEFYIVSMN